MDLNVKFYIYIYILTSKSSWLYPTTEISAFGRKLGYNWHLQHKHKEYEQYQ